ncbi:MAG TPA: endonuclease, partial [Paludibacteraceae bacterium]|nr:endonuclease [Paludibacteraceae bacterium]HRU73262.1 endonuclease [Paludibacteraceae bacterium]
FCGVLTVLCSEIRHCAKPQTDIRMNSARSNLPYGNLPEKPKNCDVGYGKGGSAGYTSDGVATTVFDPGDAGYKGDIARSYFYMATRYRDKNMAISTEAQVMFAYSNNVCDFTLYSIDLLMSWHRNDPVSLKERIRNDAIYQHQGNRNPFIDYPCLAEYIWGDSIGKNVDFSKLASAYDATFSGQGCPCQQPYIIVSPDSLSFESTPNVPVTQTFTISGENLVGNVTLSGAVAPFTVDNITFIPTDGSLSSTTVTVTYTPTAVGEHTTTLSITDGVATATIALNGTCVAGGTPDTLPKIVIGVPVGETLVLPSGVNSKILHLQVENLIGDITLTLSDVTGGFAINKSTVTKTEGTNGVQLIITRTGVGGATLTFGGAINKTLILTGE